MADCGLEDQRATLERNTYFHLRNIVQTDLLWDLPASSSIKYCSYNPTLL